jgi:hypothetical protein
MVAAAGFRCWQVWDMEYDWELEEAFAGSIVAYCGEGRDKTVFLLACQGDFQGQLQ